jgi:hypothetical protein
MRKIGLLFVIFLGGNFAMGQTLSFLNADVHQVKSLNDGLSAADEMKAGANPFWLAYTFATINRLVITPCDNFSEAAEGAVTGQVLLEAPYRYGPSFNTVTAKDGHPQQAVLLARYSKGHVQKIWVTSGPCPINAGGLAVISVTDADQARSLEFLNSIVHRGTTGEESYVDQAMLAISVHEAERATGQLASYVAEGQPLALRKRAIFWIGLERGDAGLTWLERFSREDLPAEIADDLPYAISITASPRSATLLTELAAKAPTQSIREKAQFWLAKSAGDHATEVLINIAEHSPWPETRKSAVFAVSQLPRPAAIEGLHRLSGSSLADVRETALFWMKEAEKSPGQ